MIVFCRTGIEDTPAIYIDNIEDFHARVATPNFFQVIIRQCNVLLFFPIRQEAAVFVAIIRRNLPQNYECGIILYEKRATVTKIFYACIFVGKQTIFWTLFSSKREYITYKKYDFCALPLDMGDICKLSHF